MSKESEASAVWSSQLLYHICRNLVSTQTIDSATMRTILKDTHAQMVATNPQLRAELNEYLAVYNAGINGAEEFLANRR